MAILGSIRQEFLKPDGVRLGLTGNGVKAGAEVQSYEYESAAAAQADAAQLGPDGSPPTMMITWIGPPHFFRKERIIALYVGADATVTGILTELLGQQFAGR